MHLIIFTASTMQSGVLKFRLVDIEFSKLDSLLRKFFCEVNSGYLDLCKHILEALSYKVLELLIRAKSAKLIRL